MTGPAADSSGYRRAGAETPPARIPIDIIRCPVLVLDCRLRVLMANRAFYSTFGLDAAGTERRLIYALDGGRWDIPGLRTLLERVLAAGGGFSDVEIEHEFASDDRRTIAVSGHRLARNRRILLSIEDLTGRRQAEHRQWLLTAELRHRANNILAAVRAMASRTYLTSRSLKEFWIRFDGRLQALGMAQNLATQSTFERVDLHDLVTEELRIHAIHQGEAVSVDGPDIELTGKCAEALAMTVHELTTNAINHGALSEGDGRVDIRWAIRGDELELEWVETGVSHLRRPRKRGFGLDIIEEGVKYTLDGEADVKFGADGVRCTVRFPLDAGVMAPRAQNGVAPSP